MLVEGSSGDGKVSLRTRSSGRSHRPALYRAEEGCHGNHVELAIELSHCRRYAPKDEGSGIAVRSQLLRATPINCRICVSRADAGF